jgi:tRNA threonylcarbamoyladenosine biosynthesis protein TsaB
MKVLAIDSSSVVAGAAILDDDRLLCEAYHHHKRNHSEILMPLVEEALDSSGLAPDQIDLFAVSSGPGSFTGLRIGISTIKGLAQALEKPVAAVPTLDALAYNIAYTDALVCPIMDARREQVYTSLYRREENGYSRILPYSAVPVEQLKKELLAFRQPILFVGDGIPAYRNMLMEMMGASALFAPPYLAYQRASVIACLGRRYALAGESIDCRDLQPFYLRQSQAEQKKFQQIGGEV